MNNQKMTNHPPSTDYITEEVMILISIQHDSGGNNERKRLMVLYSEWRKVRTAARPNENKIYSFTNFTNK